MKKNKTQITEWNVLDYLRTEKDIANYLQAALEENDIEFFLVALGDVAKARSINKIAKAGQMAVLREHSREKIASELFKLFEYHS